MLPRPRTTPTMAGPPPGGEAGDDDVPPWDILLDVLILMSVALVLGTIAEQLRQSAVLGYLAAGTVVGPSVLGLVQRGEHLTIIAELGVSMLLFTIGLEFSVRRLRRLGRMAIVGGTAQVLVTLLVAGVVSLVAGSSLRGSIAIGAMVSLSSTACVLRVLVDRGSMDSQYGRNAMAVLLLQDAAVIPLVLVVAALATGGSTLQMGMSVVKALVSGGLMAAVFIVFVNVVVPRVLNLERFARNRELPILFGIACAVGAAYVAHEAGISPAIGAFIGGVLLGGTHFATQIRADVASLRAILVTIFFASVGLVGDPQWVLDNLGAVLVTLLLVVIGKAAIIATIVRAMGGRWGVGVGTGLALAQLGEFSFVLGEIAVGDDPASALLSAEGFKLLVSVSIISLFLTPLLVSIAPQVAGLVERWQRGSDGPGRSADESDGDGHVPPAILVIGYGPAGQAVADALYDSNREAISILELNARNADVARRLGLRVEMGDATNPDVLEHAGVMHARVVAVTVADPTVVRTVVRLVRSMRPNVAIVARARYHIRRWEIEFAGATAVVDEEYHVGLRLAALTRRHLDDRDPGRGPDPSSPPGADEPDRAPAETTDERGQR